MSRHYFKKGIVGKSAVGAIFCSLILLASMTAAIDLSTETTEEIYDLSYTYLFKEPNLKPTIANNQEYTLLEIEVIVSSMTPFAFMTCMLIALGI